ncbi:class A beta-lactamase [Altererythrobacter xixiisoli]|uniref:Beta-lactamase n=1 Tax=Croceibacterium xixiisoli TaxID=1476466 RepID=A0A6I4TYL7_9SPHN|nr:class A beta-lactamase [Croceibacterium xixiisoli]MXP00200.1 class A beta-lactamase [Croceibacterium xixiisoli]
MKLGKFGRIAAGLTLAFATATTAIAPAQARDGNIEAAFDTAFGTDIRAPRDFTPNYRSALEQQIAALAEGSSGRIGVAAIDLSTGQEVAILGDQRFPMASTSKIAIAATFLEGVDQGKWSLSSEFPLMVPIRSARFSTTIAPVRQGEFLTAQTLIDMMITRSSNPATDALLAAVGGPSAVNDWARRAGINEFQLSRDIATLVRDDGEIDPAVSIDVRDSSTPRAMVQLLTGLYQGQWLSSASRHVVISAMERCRTGTRRIPALMPGGVTVAHKTGSLNNTSSDIGIITAPDGRSIAVAIYVTGQGTRDRREARIANIARAIYDGYAQQGQNASSSQQWVNARY